jgi:hypothetical protein
MFGSGKMIIGGVLGLGLVGTAWAGDTVPQDNRCWGDIASQVARSDNPTNSGGGMGWHSRSGTAAGINGGFATTGIIQQPRQGVGNVSSSPPHNTDPGDGGNGQHAVNNGFLAATLDPVTGGAGDGVGLTCDSRDVEVDLQF